MTTTRPGAPIPTDTMDRIVEFVDKGRDISATDVLYDAVDDALYAGHDAQSWPDIEALLNDPRWVKMPLGLLIGALVITLPVKGKIGNARSSIIALIKALNLPETRDSRLLAGLEEP
jgi:hypothetical protein